MAQTRDENETFQTFIEIETRPRRSRPRPIRFSTLYIQVCLKATTRRSPVQFTHFILSQLNKCHASSWHYQKFTYCNNQIRQLSV